MPLKILLADDSMTAQNMGKKILTEAGYDVIAVSNGAQAVKKMAEKPDLAVLDVYMPGYTGVEVCERIKKAQETAHIPVILTYGKMEAFRADDGTKAGCDGLIVKPFEASDLLAAIKKIEEKMAAAAAPPSPPAAEYEDTIKISMPVVEEFKDASYEAWKTSEAPPEEAPAAPAFSVPEEMAGAPAMGLEDFGVSAPAPVMPEAEATAPLETPIFKRTTETIEPAIQAAAAVAAAAAPEPEPEMAAPSIESLLEATSAPAVAEPEPAAPPELEFTSAPRGGEVPAAPARDPGLVTDAEELAKFTTKFGVEGAEPITVGVAAEMPELYADARPAEAPAAEAAPPPPAPEKLEAEIDFEARVAAAMSAYEPPAAEPPAVEAPPTAVMEAPAVEPEPAAIVEAPAVEAAAEPAAEAGPSFIEEMQRAVAAMPVAAAPVEEPAPVEIAPPPPPEPAHVSVVPESIAPSAPDHELARAMAAAVGASVEPQITAAVAESTQKLSPDLIASIVHRVVDRMKPELVQEITKELEQQLKK